MIEKILSEVFIYYKKDYIDNITINDVEIYANVTKNKQINELLNFIINFYDGNKNEIIDFEEITIELQDKNNADSMKCVFTIFDKNSDDFLEITELQAVIEYIKDNSIDADEVSKIMKNFKGQNNDKINYTDFLKIIKII